MEKLSLRSSILLALLALGAMVVAFGCSQGGGDGQTPSAPEDTNVVERGTTVEDTVYGNQITTVEQTNASAGEDDIREEPSPDAQQNGQTVTVRVAGTEGLSFEGKVGGVQELKQVQGTTPEEYELPVKSDSGVVTASIRKRTRDEGSIKVEVVREGQVVVSNESSGGTGVVNVVWSSNRGARGE